MIFALIYKYFFLPAIISLDVCLSIPFSLETRILDKIVQKSLAIRVFCAIIPY